jgi:putative membrane protein
MIAQAPVGQYWTLVPYPPAARRARIRLANTAPMDTSTQLAIERTQLAHERTLMAWVRTAVSLISFGFTIYKFFEYLVTSGQREASGSLLGPRHFGMLMMGTALVILVLAMLQHRRQEKRLRQMDATQPRSLSFLLAMLITTLGLLALLAAAFRI